MTNVVQFKRKSEPDRFPEYTLDETAAYKEVETLYCREGVRLGLWFEKGDGPTPTYLVLHDGSGNKAMCLRIWEPLEADNLGADEVVRQSLLVARGLDHEWRSLRD